MGAEARHPHPHVFLQSAPGRHWLYVLCGVLTLDQDSQKALPKPPYPHNRVFMPMESKCGA